MASVWRFFTFFFFFTVALVQADTVQILNLSLPVEKFEQVDRYSYSISVGGEHHLLRRSEAEMFVVEHIFTHSEEADRYSGYQVREFFRLALEKERSDLVLPPLRYIIQKEEFSSEDFENILQFCTNEQQKKKFLEKAIKYFYKNKVKREVLVDFLSEFAVVSSPVEFQKFEKLSVRYKKNLSGQYEKRYIRFLKREEFHQATLFAHKIEKLSFDKLLIENVNRSESILKNLQKIKSVDDVFHVQTMLGEFQEKSPFRDVLSSLLSGEIESQAEDFLKRQEFLPALRLLSHMDFNKRTLKTHSLVSTLLSKLDTKDAPSLRDTATFNLLKYFSLKDKKIQRHVTELFEAQIYSSLKEKKPSRAESSFEKLIEIRPDPEKRNDRLRVRLALGYLDRGFRLTARDRIAQIQTGIGLFDRARLIFSGLYINPFLLLLFFTIPFLLAGVAVYQGIFRKDRKQKSVFENEGRAESEKDQELRKGFLFRGTGKEESELRREYNHLLRVFGLHSDATLKNIKIAYRNSVKEVHPDTATVQNQSTSDRFIELNGQYERLLELYEKLKNKTL